MTDTSAAQGRDDARALQAKLYREIGVSAVAAALLSTPEPESAPRPPAVDEAREMPQVAQTRAA